jgi:ectoine hydroxylase
MRLTTEQRSFYDSEGYLLLPNLFSPREVDVMKAELPALYAEESEGRVLEKDGRTVRSLHGTHSTNEVFRRLAQHPRLVGPAEQVLGTRVYVHQFKINAKMALAGDVWQWHQDFIFWLKQDGMREPLAVNAMVFLDDVNEFNGPLLVVPRSHRLGVIESAPKGEGGMGPSWVSSFAADLKYTVDKSTLGTLVAEHGIVGPKGPRGSVLFTHCNIVHGSSPNMSPFDRTLAIVTFNSVANALLPVENPRPEFLVTRSNMGPIDAVSDDALLFADVAGAGTRDATAFHS